jgi:choline-sulfatase
MRILFLDIDTLRPDHLGCYGYHRPTSPAIDAIAAEGVRCEGCHASDVPCLPARSALITGRFGIHNGAINHGGVAADLFHEGPARGFRTQDAHHSYASALRRAGLHTCSISSFPERHSSYHWLMGFSEHHDPSGKGGGERAEEVVPTALDWLDQRGAKDGWFLHLHLWDPHTPYRAPEDCYAEMAKHPLPAWYSDEIRQRHWQLGGPHSAQEFNGFAPAPHMAERWPRHPDQIASLDDARKMFDGYDAGVLWADRQIALVVDRLKSLGIYEETAIVISSDHGETLGELGMYGDHQVADAITCRVPMIIKWPGLKPGVNHGLHYHIDIAAAVIELAGGQVPDRWDGRSCAAALRAGDDGGRDQLVLSQGAWSCQRSVRWGDNLLIRSYHDGYHDFPTLMLFDIRQDPHEQHDLAAQRPELVREGQARLEGWLSEQLGSSPHAIDPMLTVLREGGPYHCRGKLPKYLERLRATGRSAVADSLAAKHPAEAKT